MATFKICVFKHQQRRDHKFPVYIRVCWKRKYGYIRTSYYVTIQQIRKTKYIFELKDTFIINELNSQIRNFEDAKVKLGNRIELYTAKELADYFVKENHPGTDSSIDFVAFAQVHFKRLEDRGKKTTAAPLKAALNAMIDYSSGRKQIYITEISAKFLEGFDTFLRNERTIKRINQHGKMVTTKRHGCSDVGVFDYMKNISIIFNAAKREYNDYDRGEIRVKHDPFQRYKAKKIPEPEKRALTLDQLLKIRNVKTLKDKRAILARDVFMLSFLCAGMNMVDLYNLKKKQYRDDRFSYHRAKTRDRRKDKAFISIKVFPEVLPYIEKYQSKSGDHVFSFAGMYTTSDIFCSNINIGLKKVAEKVNECITNEAIEKEEKVNESLFIPDNLNTYFARFTFATFARNNCGVSRDDIDLALNHVDHGLKMADVYIKKDWSLVDNVIRKVIEYVG